MLLGNVVIYLVGVPWLMAATGFDLGTGLSKGVYPFLVGDLLKLALAGSSSRRPGGWSAAATAPLTDSDAAGVYGPGSAAWARNRDAFLLLGAGPRALLLQLAHPLVAEGVAQHSDFRADPWSRLAGTLRTYLRIVYAGAPGRMRRSPA